MGRMKDLMIEFQDMDESEFEYKITKIMDEVDSILKTSNHDIDFEKKLRNYINEYIELLFGYSYVTNNLSNIEIESYLEVMFNWLVKHSIEIDSNVATSIYALTTRIKNKSTSEITWELNNTKKQLEMLKKEKNESSKKEIARLSKIIEKKEQEIKKSELEKQRETQDIKLIIEFLGSTPKEIIEDQIILKKQRNIFYFIAYILLTISLLIAIFLIMNLFKKYLSIPEIKNIGQYLAITFPIIFPMLVSLIFFKYGNTKQKELEQTNFKSILVQDVKRALESYNVMLKGEELKEKTILSIDMIINKVFQNNHINSDNTEKNNIELGKASKIISDIIKVSK